MQVLDPSPEDAEGLVLSGFAFQQTQEPSRQWAWERRVGGKPLRGQSGQSSGVIRPSYEVRPPPPRPGHTRVGVASPKLDRKLQKSHRKALGTFHSAVSQVASHVTTVPDGSQETALLGVGARSLCP